MGASPPRRSRRRRQKEARARKGQGEEKPPIPAPLTDAQIEAFKGALTNENQRSEVVRTKSGLDKGVFQRVASRLLANNVIAREGTRRTTVFRLPETPLKDAIVNGAGHVTEGLGE